MSPETIAKISASKTKFHPQPFTCKACGKTFLRKAYPMRNPMFCDKACRDALGGRKGIPLSKESGDRMSERMMGEKNHMYKDGRNALKYREDAEDRRMLRKWRTQVLTKNGRICALCAEPVTQAFVDHILPYINHPDLRYEVSNGQVLCGQCNRMKTDEDLKKVWRNQYAKGPGR